MAPCSGGAGSPSSPGRDGGGHRVVKRLLDVVLAGLALVIAAPLLAIAAVAIRLASPRPIVYRAERIGRGRRPFVMYKLRTMHAPRRGDGSPVTGKHDPRVFPLGSWLGRAKPDERPPLGDV